MTWIVSYRVDGKQKRVFFNSDSDINFPSFFPESDSKDEAIEKVKDYLVEVYQENCLDAKATDEKLEMYDPADNEIIVIYSDFDAVDEEKALAEIYTCDEYDNEIWATVDNEKMSINMMFGSSFTNRAEFCALLFDPCWIYDGLNSYYWENHYEFERGLESAQQLAEDVSISYEQALQEVFGPFVIKYEIEDQQINPFFNINVDKEMMRLLLND